MTGHSLAFSFFAMLLLAATVIGAAVGTAWLIIRHLGRNERKAPR